MLERASQPRIAGVSAAAYTIPTETPESDGTLEWSATTLVVVHLEAHGAQGLGYGYADKATAVLIHERLLPLLEAKTRSPRLPSSTAWCAR